MARDLLIKDFLHFAVDPDEFEKMRSRKKLTVEDEKRLHGVESMLFMVYEALSSYNEKVLPPRMRRVYRAIKEFLKSKPHIDLFNELAMYYGDLPYSELPQTIKRWNKALQEQHDPNFGSVSVPAHTLKDATQAELKKGAVWLTREEKNPYRDKVRREFLQKFQKDNIINPSVLRVYKAIRKKKVEDSRGEDRDKDLEELIKVKLKYGGIWHKTVEELEQLTNKPWKELKPVILDMDKAGTIDYRKKEKRIIFNARGDMDQDESSIPVHKLPKRR